ncbi:MAG: YgjV family protein [Spirochaetales bacterium]|nr:YgjV family protein [Spirochaetales bacterium]
MDRIEIFGLVASVIVALALTQKSVLRLRVINLIGSVCFIIYGYYIWSLPVMALNTFTTLTNLYYLNRMRKVIERLEILTPGPEEKTFISHFLNSNRDDILSFYPQLDPEALLEDESCRFFPILRNGHTVSLVVCRQSTKTNWHIVLDYATPDFRDLKCGHYFYSTIRETLKRAGLENIESISTESDNRAHQKYLLRLGFAGTGTGRYVMTL